MIDVTCPQCGVVYHSEELHIGKQLRCGRCGSHVPILKAEKAVVQQPPATPKNSSTWGPRQNATRRHEKRHISFVVAALLLAGVIVTLVFHYAEKPSTQVSSANSSGAGITIGEHPSAGSAQTNNATTESGGLHVIGEEPIQATDHIPKANVQKFAPREDPRPTHYNSLPNGAHIGDVACNGGHGKLTVQNGTSEDAVVRLYDFSTGETICWFFVEARNSAQEMHVPQGTYRLAYTSGLDWIESQDIFQWHPSYSEFERILEYNEKRDDDGVQYHDISVTLQPVPDGNVHTKHISREEFLKGYRHVSLQR